MNFFQCEICYNNKYTKVTSLGYQFKNEFVARCKKCKLIQLANSEIKNNLNYYKSGQFNSEIRGFEQIDEKQIKLRVDRAEQRILLLKKKFNNLRKNILEIGCGFGPLINILYKKFNSNVSGVEPSKNFANFGNNFYNTDFIFSGDYQDYNNYKKQDIILIYQVIEHITDYETFFARLKKNIHSDTTIVVEFPDIFQSLKNRKYLSPNGYFQKSHLYDYDPYTLSLLFKKYGYDAIEYIPSKQKSPNDKNSTFLFKQSKNKNNFMKKYKKFRASSIKIFFKVTLLHFLFKMKKKIFN